MSIDIPVYFCYNYSALLQKRRINAVKEGTELKSFAVKAAIVILFCFIIKIALPYAVDPHNVFHTDNIRNYGVEPNANYIKMTYILNNKDKFNAFMFGSSRVGSIHTDKIPGVRCYNMNYAFGKPSEFLANINTFLENGIVPERIYLGLDVSSYAVDSSDHLTSTQCMPYEYAKENPEVFFNAYFDPLMVLRSLPLIFEGKGMDGYRVFYTNGCRIDYDEEGGGWDTTMRHYAGECDDPETAIAEALSVIREIKELCEENGIEIVVFTNPMYRSTYEASVEMDYYGFLRGLSEVQFQRSERAHNGRGIFFGGFALYGGSGRSGTRIHDIGKYRPRASRRGLRSLCYRGQRRQSHRYFEKQRHKVRRSIKRKETYVLC